ncbi:L-idonate 5-dehydrogenase [Mycoplana rhizolycopersici]|uniref:L-idonate 5-dehydrogenase n=1 Tax=Mycoplana rhizolycopersici TaxID=2746702 RepID=A0ABX2QMB0_9HYPH|nr:L-idonate 5-dehydrogenase [Rhizobium rhizolycopersici]NVP57481.1 L-idonate 5-dehydrogenase [Rhizobium rhizolycopersici]
MRAVVAHAAHDLRLEERPEEAAPGEGQVLVRVAAGGICGSDLHYFHNGGFGTVRLREPMILGHEASAVVAAVGKGVAGLTPGDLVAINPSLPCGQCEECRRGLRNHCNDMMFRGSAMRFPHAQGLFRETLVVPAGLLHPVGPGVDAGLAALAEPFAVCLHAVKQAGSLLGKTVLVSGCGPIGCLTVAAARLAGARHVIACDVVEAPLKFAERLGADEVVLVGADATGLAPYKAGKGGIDVAFDCSGHPAAVATAIECLRPRGALVAVGLGGSMPFPLPSVVTKELAVFGSFRFDTEFGEAVDLIARGRVDLSPLISHTYPVDRAVEAFDLAGDRSQAMKVQIDFG